MPSSLRSFSQNNPKRAKELIAQWQDWTQRHPETSDMDEHELAVWANERGLKVDLNILGARDVVEAYFFPTSQQEELPAEDAQSMHGPHGKSSLLSLLFFPLAFRKGELLEDDIRYMWVEHAAKNEWLKTHGKVDFKSKEGLDFLYDSLDGPNTTLQKQTEAQFRKSYPKFAEHYDEQKLKHYDNPAKDPALKLLSEHIGMHTLERFALYQKENPKSKITYQEFHDKKIGGIAIACRERAYDDFVIRYKEKASHYKEQDEHVQAAIQRLTHADATNYSPEATRAKQFFLAEERAKLQQQPGALRLAPQPSSPITTAQNQTLYSVQIPTYSLIHETTTVEGEAQGTQTTFVSQRVATPEPTPIVSNQPPPGGESRWAKMLKKRLKGKALERAQKKLGKRARKLLGRRVRRMLIRRAAMRLAMRATLTAVGSAVGILLLKVLLIILAACVVLAPILLLLKAFGIIGSDVEKHVREATEVKLVTLPCIPIAADLLMLICSAEVDEADMFANNTSAVDKFLTNKLPPDTKFISATGNYYCVPGPCGEKSKAVVWPLAHKDNLEKVFLVTQRKAVTATPSADFKVMTIEY